MVAQEVRDAERWSRQQNAKMSVRFAQRTTNIEVIEYCDVAHPKVPSVWCKRNSRRSFDAASFLILNYDLS